VASAGAPCLAGFCMPNEHSATAKLRWEACKPSLFMHPPSYTCQGMLAEWWQGRCSGHHGGPAC